MDLLTVGESFEDVIFAGLPRMPRLGEELRVSSISTHPGGGAIITAVAAARLGLRTGVLSALSAANVLRLRPEHISVANLRRPPEPGAIPVALSIPLAGLMTAAVGLVFGVPAARIKGLYLAIATLAAQFILEDFFARAGWFLPRRPCQP